MDQPEFDIKPRRVAIQGDGRVAVLMPYPPLDGAQACAGTSSDQWIPEDGAPGKPKAREAKALCDGCPFRVACGEWAIAHEEYGVWGGMSPYERDLIRAVRGQRLVDPMYAHLYGLADAPLALPAEPAEPVEGEDVTSDRAWLAS